MMKKLFFCLNLIVIHVNTMQVRHNPQTTIYHILTDLMEIDQAENQSAPMDVADPMDIEEAAFLQANRAEDPVEPAMPPRLTRQPAIANLVPFVRTLNG